MDIRPINSVGAHAPVSIANPLAVDDMPARPVVAAIRQINKAELMGQGRQLTFTRDPVTRQPVINIVDRNTGEVIDQLPPATVLQLASNLK